jgi:uncharacterized membrane protein
MARRGNDSVLLTAAALGAIAGARSMAAPALLAHELSEIDAEPGDSVIERFLASDAGSRILALVAGGEMLADKLPFIGDRTDALPLVGRAVIGSLTAAAYAAYRRSPVLAPAAVGAAAAIASAYILFQARRFASESLHLPDHLVGFAEDALVVAASRELAQAIHQG